MLAVQVYCPIGIWEPGPCDCVSRWTSTITGVYLLYGSGIVKYCVWWMGKEI